MISGTVGSLKAFFVAPFDISETAANSLLGFVVSSALLGCVVGGFLGGWVGQRLGRKQGLVLSAVLFLVSALGSSVTEFPAQEIGSGDHRLVYWFVFYRILGGWDRNGFHVSLYIAEIAPANRRGQLVSLNQFAIVVGILIVLLRQLLYQSWRRRT